MSIEFKPDITISPTFLHFHQDLAPLRVAEAINCALLSDRDRWVGLNPQTREIKYKNSLRTNIVVVGGQTIQEFEISAKSYKVPEDVIRIYNNTELAVSRGVKTPQIISVIRVGNQDDSVDRAIIVSERMRSTKSLTRRRMEALVDSGSFKLTDLLKEFMSVCAHNHKLGITLGHAFPGHFRYIHTNGGVPKPIFYNLEYSTVLNRFDLTLKNRHASLDEDQKQRFEAFERDACRDIGGIFAQLKHFGLPMSEKVLLKTGSDMYLRTRGLKSIWGDRNRKPIDYGGFSQEIEASYRNAKKVLEVRY